MSGTQPVATTRVDPEEVQGLTRKEDTVSRFNNLEFGKEHEGELQGQTRQKLEAQRAPAKNEGFYLAEAKTAFESGLFEKALRAYSKVLEFDPANAAAWVGQVRMLIELGEFQEAKVWADKALERFPNCSELLAAKAVALARLGDLKAARTYSDAAMEERDDTPYVWLARGDVQLACSEKRADFCFEKAASMASHDWFVRWLAARVYHYYKKFALAVKLLQEALSFNAAQGVVWLQLGLTQQALGLLGSARDSLIQARELCAEGAGVDEAMKEMYHVGFWGRLQQRWQSLF